MSGAEYKPMAAIKDEVSRRASIYSVLEQNIITMPESKLRELMQECNKNAGRRTKWQVPLALVAAFLSTFSTANFHEKWFWDATHWEVAFSFATVISAGWLIYTIVQAFRTKSPDNIVDDLMSTATKLTDDSSPNPDTPNNDVIVRTVGAQGPQGFSGHSGLLGPQGYRGDAR